MLYMIEVKHEEAKHNDHYLHSHKAKGEKEMRKPQAYSCRIHLILTVFSYYFGSLYDITKAFSSSRTEIKFVTDTQANNIREACVSQYK